MQRLALLAAALLLTAAPAAAHGPSVKLSYGRVSPPQLGIRAGDTVHFHNHSTTPRTFTVRGADGAFERDPITGARRAPRGAQTRLALDGAVDAGNARDLTRRAVTTAAGAEQHTCEEGVLPESVRHGLGAG